MHSLAKSCHQWGTKLKENSCLDCTAVCSAMNAIGNCFLPRSLSTLSPHHQFIRQHALPWPKTSYFLRVECFNMSIHMYILKTLLAFPLIKWAQNYRGLWNLRWPKPVIWQESPGVKRASFLAFCLFPGAVMDFFFPSSWLTKIFCGHPLIT